MAESYDKKHSLSETDVNATLESWLAAQDLQPFTQPTEGEKEPCEKEN